MENTIRVNFNLDKDIHYQVRKMALDKRTTARELYTKWTLEGIRKETEQTRLDDIE